MPEAFIQLGNLLLERDDPSQALVYVLRDLQLNPPSADVLWLGFRTERKLGDADAAAGYAKRLQTDFPGSDQARMLESGVVQ
jgi:type IV pilus assembly protein PilF